MSSDPAEAAPAGAADATDAAGILREQHAWRERALRGIGWSVCGAVALIAAWFAIVPSPMPEMRWVLGLGAAIQLGALLEARLPFGLRVGVVLAVVYVPAAYALSVGGFTPNPFIGFGMIVVTATLLVGRRVGLALFSLSVATIIGVSWGHVTGRLTRAPGWVQSLDSTRPAVVIRVALVFSLLTLTLVIAVSYLLGRAEELLVEKSRSLEALRKEQQERERIARDLELREAAFHKARELELLGRLAGTMAHDFNNALLVIWSALDELAASEQGPAVAPALAAIRTAAEQAAATTRQLRAFGPVGPPRPSELALAPVLEKARLTFARVLPQNIRLTVDVQVAAVIVADEGELLRVLMNLALNARDAMRDGGELTLRVRTPYDEELPEPRAASGYVAIDVEDTGSGMSEDVKSRLFEPFFTTKQASGTGLGLASVRDLVEAQGGLVTVKSELGLGTTLSVLWPLATEGVARAETPTPAPSAHPAVVLLVDDEEPVRLALSRGLSRLGMTVLVASDGASGLVAARRYAGTIDVLCTDCVMPGLPVSQLIAGFRELCHGCVIVCSGYAPAETGLSPDLFDDFLAKPFSIEDLAKRIHLMRQKRARDVELKAGPR